MEFPPIVWLVPWIVFAIALVVVVYILVGHFKHIRPLEKQYDPSRRRQLLWQRGFFALLPLQGVLLATQPGKGVWLIKDALPLNFVIYMSVTAIWLVTLVVIINIKYPKSKL